MKSHRWLLLFVLVGITIWSKATDFRTERIFIASTASDYRPGDSITIMGQIFATDTLKTPFSKYLYVEIFDRNDSVLLRKKLASDEQGRFVAQIHTSPIWEPDLYYMRAYTKLMQNFSPKAFPVVPLQIGKKVIKPEMRPTVVNCHFYPEGGTLVKGKAQRVIFQLTDYNDFPLSIPYYIIAGKDTLDNQQTTPSGLQQFLYTPRQEAMELHAYLDGGCHRFVLPMESQGATLQVFGNANRLTYRILTEGIQTDTLKLYSFHQETGLCPMNINGQQAGIIDSKSLSSGLLTLFLTDSQNNILSERSVYIESEKKFLSLSLDKQVYQPGEKLALSETDSIRTFVRFYLEEYWCGPHAQSALNWTSDLVSEFPFPIHYFQANNQTRALELDCWLATSSFVRFDLKQVLEEGFSYKYPYENVLTIDGRVTNRFNGKIKEGTMNAFNTQSGSAHQGEVDEEGKFSIPVTDFDEGSIFFISCMAGKKRQGGFYRYLFNDEVFPGVINLHPQRKEKALGDIEVEIGTEPTSAYGIDKNNLLPEVRVKAKTNAEEYVPTNRFYKMHFVDVELEDKYHNFASIIADIPVITLDVKKTPQAHGPMKIDYSIYPTRGRTALNMEHESTGVVILVDGMRVTANEAVQFLPFELSTVEYLPPKDAIKVTSGAIYGALVIKTRKAKIPSAKDVKSQGIQYSPMGLANKDLHWNKGMIPTHVPNKAGRYRVLIDQITDTGEILSKEFLIEVK